MGGITRRVARDERDHSDCGCRRADHLGAGGCHGVRDAGGGGSSQSVSAGPVHSPFFADVEHVIWLSRLTRQAKTLAYSLLAPETLGEEGLYYGTVPDVGGGWATDLMAELDETRLKSLVVVDIRMPNPEWFDRPESQEIVAGMAQISGADHWTERVALLLFESDTYMVGFNLLRYGDDWKVYEQKSNIAGLHQSGTAWPVTASLFLERTSEKSSATLIRRGDPAPTGPA